MILCDESLSGLASGLPSAPACAAGAHVGGLGLESSQPGTRTSGVKSKPIGHVSKHGPRSIACVQV